MNDLFTLLISGVSTYGAPLFGLILLLGQFGVPLPTSLLVIAVGAFSRLGVVDWGLAATLGLVGSVVGDSLGFAVGRFGQNWIQKKFGNHVSFKQARASFEQKGGLVIFVTRFMVTAGGVPTNLIAGGSGYNYPRFLGISLTGEAVWLLLYGGLGYLFGSQWEAVAQFLTEFSGMAIITVLVAAGLVEVVRRINRKQRQSIGSIKAN
jgi:membrane-associated protein